MVPTARPRLVHRGRGMRLGKSRYRMTKGGRSCLLRRKEGIGVRSEEFLGKGSVWTERSAQRTQGQSGL